MSTQKKWLHAGLFILIGLLLGVALGRYTVKSYRYKKMPPEKRFERKMDYLSKKLDLSDEQRIRVREIFESRRGQLDQLHDEFDPRFQAIREASVNEIRAVLNPEQNETFERMHERWKKKRDKRGPPRHH